MHSAKETPAGLRRQDAVKRVKQPGLSRIYKRSHNVSNSLIHNGLHCISMTGLSSMKIT